VTQTQLKAVVIGGSGAIGLALVNELAINDNFELITCVGRREYDCFPESDKIKQVVVDMESMDDLQNDIMGYDVAFCCLGSTRKDAGSDKEFKKIDFTYVVNFGNKCKEANIEKFHYVSSMGANKNSWFLYPRTKGEVEQALADMNFKRLYIYRPGLLDRGDKNRTVESLLGKIVKTTPVGNVAKEMIKRSLEEDSDEDRDPIFISNKTFLQDYNTGG